MGEEYILPPVLNLDNVYETSTPDSPVVFILNPGADPGKDLVKLAKRCDISDSDFCADLSWSRTREGNESVNVTGSSLI